MCNKHKILTTNMVSEFLPKRDDYANKYDFGHTLIIAGSKSYTGAPVMAVLGCLSVGCGIVSLCVPESIYALTVPRVPPETIVFAVASTPNGSIAVKSVEVVIEYIINRKVTTICIGCGLGTEDETKLFVNNLLNLIYNPHSKISEKKIFTVIDADGINLLDIEDKQITSLKSQHYQVILTPHLGEYSRLVKLTSVDKNFDYCSEILQFSKINKLVTVLKGPITIISDGEHIFHAGSPNSALAKGGSGDVLSGIISGLVFQIEKYNNTLVKYHTVLKSALLSVYLHSKSASVAEKEKTKFSVLATDIVKYIPEVIKKLFYDTVKR